MGGTTPFSTSDKPPPAGVEDPLRHPDNHNHNNRTSSSRGHIKSSRLTINLSILLCLLLLGIAITSALVWLPLIFVPLIGVIALPAFVSCLIVLIYAVPGLLYLLWAQEDSPGWVNGVFIPLNPVRNLSLTLGTIRYLQAIGHILPRFIWAVGRYIVWENLVRKVDDRFEHPGWKSERSGGKIPAPIIPSQERKRGKEGIFHGFAEYNIPYVTRRDGSVGYWDIYFPRGSTGEEDKESPGMDVDLDMALSTLQEIKSPQQAPDIDSPKPSPTSSPSQLPTSLRSEERPGSSTHPPFQVPSSSTPFRLRQQSSTPSTPEHITATASSASTPSIQSISSANEQGSKVVIFLFDVGMIGIKPRKEWFCLLGAKLGKMGYLTVIPGISLYPSGGVEDMVIDVRHVLSWVEKEIPSYGGSPSSIYIMGHGLGAHLAFFTLCQEAIIRSRDARQEFLARTKGQQVMLDLSDIKTWRIANEEVEDEVPNGLRKLKIYGEEVEIPRVKGIILLSPVFDIIRQIRYESSIHLEHVSPLRRSGGPGQTACMKNSLGHLLFASKRILEVDRLPERVLIIHGAQDHMIPLSMSHSLSELLYGLGIPTIFRPYKDMGHFDLLFHLMKGFEQDLPAESSGHRKKWYVDRLGRDIQHFINEI
ncbi:hypothetical protein I302_103224 [Kwoniella bestiolae CBS 10118]|uniref:Uncharacterized protein n=1 Tax=Kwoniella bestiolae CBS 10118 TaxID=1296100 RepID=A0A1B9G7U1_9TREE|nr:hypothetical protein I302_01923 [Kwoniella bestiolae CBS 10118]OCF27088.1 hypothetical protein I302_01923 [Kwoniella bestiolae CBS 10118]